MKQTYDMMGNELKIGDHIIKAIDNQLYKGIVDDSWDSHGMIVVTFDDNTKFKYCMVLDADVVLKLTKIG
jgi:hypothetical protein